MTITLTYLTTTITLHDDLKWSDERNWHPVAQTAQRTITGALIVSSALMVAGRPVTLEPEDDSSAWMPHSVVVALRNFAVVPGRVMQLTLKGVSRDVIFRHQDGDPIEAEPVIFYNNDDGADWYLVTLRLMEI